MNNKGKFILVLMSYDPKNIRSYIDLIEPICLKVCESVKNLEYIRSDIHKDYLGKITDHVKLLMTDCDFFIIDVSKFNSNVMYELGYLNALNKKGVLIHYGKVSDKILPFYLKHENIRSYSIVDNFDEKINSISSLIIDYFSSQNILQ